MEKINLNDYLASNEYPGRGIAVAMAPDGRQMFIGYFIMGRSENSRNRVFDPVPERGGICTMAADPDKLEDPSLIIYNPVLTLGKTHIVTNGDQTDTIFDLMSQGKSFADALRTSLGLSATICAAGLDAQVAYGIPKFRRIPLCGGEAAYALSITQQLCGHIGRRVEYVIDGEVLTVDCLMCAVCNGRAYGGGFMAGPEAQPDDGWLDVFIVRKVSRRVIAKLLMLYKNGRHFKNGQLTEAAKPYFIYRRAKSVSLRAADGRGPIIATVDGECAPCKQVSVQVQPLAGRVLLPQPAYQRFTAQKTSVK